MRIEASRETLEISFDLPLTNHTGKARIKERDSVYDYGKPFASRSRCFNSSNYVEWQICYDDPAERQRSTVEEVTFTTFRGKKKESKSLYELSEALYYFYHWDIVSDGEIQDLVRSVEVEESKFIDHRPDAQIGRDNPTDTEINGLSFHRMILKYPQLIYKFHPHNNYIAEITIREKQRAVGVQPMLYFCFPISELKPTAEKLTGRTAKPKETARLTLTPDKKPMILDMFRIFGILSESHNKDILSILNAIKQSRSGQKRDMRNGDGQDRS